MEQPIRPASKKFRCSTTSNKPLYTATSCLPRCSLIIHLRAFVAYGADTNHPTTFTAILSHIARVYPLYSRSDQSPAYQDRKYQDDAAQQFWYTSLPWSFWMISESAKTQGKYLFVTLAKELLKIIRPFLYQQLSLDVSIFWIYSL